MIFTLNFTRNKHSKGRSYIDAKYLDEITSFKVNKFLQYRRNKEGASSTTLSRDREILHKLFTWTEEHFGYSGNPIKAVKWPVINAPVVRFMDKSDMTNQIKALEKHPQLKAMVAVYIYAELRREETLLFLRLAPVATGHTDGLKSEATKCFIKKFRNLYQTMINARAFQVFVYL